MREMVRNRVEKSKLYVDLKVKYPRGSDPLGSSGKEHPSKYVKDSWYDMTKKDVEEQDTSRIMIRGNSSKKGLSDIARITSI